MQGNLSELSDATGWNPDNLIIDRFGLNYEFIQTAGLTWIDNLITGSKKDLADPRHKDHSQPYVQNYIRLYGVRKCEANALVTQPELGRALCRDAIRKYVSEEAMAEYEAEMDTKRLEMKDAIENHLREHFT